VSHVLPVDSTADVTMTVSSPLRHLCPFVDEVDEGSVNITWQVNGATFELHSLHEYLDGFKDSELSHEAITDLIRHNLSVTQGIEIVSVTTHWQTAGMDVQCSTSPTPVVPR
jgi:NADPH-dependent 7-cyano-7-deazaguanine reductase QueF